MFGSFSQWVVFEMKGIRPVLVRKLSVEVGTREVQKTVEKLRKQLGFDRWTLENRELQPYGSSNDKFMDELQRKYEVWQHIYGKRSHWKVASRSLVFLKINFQSHEITKYILCLSFLRDEQPPKKNQKQ